MLYKIMYKIYITTEPVLNKYDFVYIWDLKCTELVVSIASYLSCYKVELQCWELWAEASPRGAVWNELPGRRNGEWWSLEGESAGHHWWAKREGTDREPAKPEPESGPCHQGVSSWLEGHGLQQQAWWTAGVGASGEMLFTLSKFAVVLFELWCFTTLSLEINKVYQLTQYHLFCVVLHTNRLSLAGGWW